MKTLTLEELFARSKSLPKNELILDVRTPEEYAEGHVPGSRNISHEGVGAHADELRGFSTVYIYCRSGGRVQMAMAELAAHGLTNLAGVVSGGMPNWAASGWPVEK
ncbi:MAG: rhodanese-like domain-containing protein [Deltaproteobacteria bacterium]|nr:rhodanese-like domain-containing protein [Deltaproteobacteria bacterium]